MTARVVVVDEIFEAVVDMRPSGTTDFDPDVALQLLPGYLAIGFDPAREY